MPEESQLEQPDSNKATTDWRRVYVLVMLSAIVTITLLYSFSTYFSG